MTGTRADIARAERDAAAAKARVQETLARLKNRLNPSIRAHEVWEDVCEKGGVVADDAIELAYERPQLIASVVGAGAMLLLRHQLARLVRRIFHRPRTKWDAPQFDRTNRPAPPSAGSEGDRR